MQQNKKYFAAIYIRLSKEDTILENSIKNQKDFIFEYLKKEKDIIVQNTYIDNGYSGVNFERPAFLSMIEKIKNKELNCIVIKDFSRLGRNFLETSKYIEKIFPFLGVRLISIHDFYDSLHIKYSFSNLIVPIKNLMNDAYSYDISIKIRSQLEVKRKNGEYLAPFAVYGYEKDPFYKNHLRIDPFASKVVEDIFNWKLEGMSLQSIAEKLNKEEILSPMEYKKCMGLSFYTPFKTTYKAKWSPMAVLRILKNPIYIGTLEQGKQSTQNYKTKKRREKPKEEWICIENNHIPLIDKFIFHKVNQLLEADTRVSPKQNKVSLLAGLLYCADCKQGMVKKINNSKKKKYIYYICSSYKRGEGCNSHSIQENILENAILSSVKKQVFCLLDLESIWKELNVLKKEERKIEKIKAQEKIKRLEAQQYEFYIEQLEKDYKEGLLKKAYYILKKEEYTKEKVKIEQIVAQLKKNLFLLHQKAAEEEKQKKIIKKIDHKLLAFFINKILVYKNKRICIEFLFKR